MSQLTAPPDTLPIGREELDASDALVAVAEVLMPGLIAELKDTEFMAHAKFHIPRINGEYRRLIQMTFKDMQRMNKIIEDQRIALHQLTTENDSLKKIVERRK